MLAGRQGGGAAAIVEPQEGVGHISGREERSERSEWENDEKVAKSELVSHVGRNYSMRTTMTAQPTHANC